jgi:hypothetical protein
MYHGNKLVLVVSLYPHREVDLSMKREGAIEYINVDSASKALCLLEQNPDKFDLILIGLDMHLGSDSRINQHPATRRLPFLCGAALAAVLWELRITVRKHIMFSFSDIGELLSHIDPEVMRRISAHGTLHFAGSCSYNHFDYVDAVLADLGIQRRHHAQS